MKKLVILMVLFLLCAFSSVPVYADSSLLMDAGIGLGYYYLYPKDVQVKDYYRGELTYRAFLNFKAESGLGVAGELGFYREGNRSAGAPYGTQLTIIPITISMAYHFFRNTRLSPYLGGGLGIYNINESDPDLQTTKFGKHIFAGFDLYLSPDTILRLELRQAMIDPVNSEYYYSANFGGFTALVSLAVEMPVSGPEAKMTSEEKKLYRKLKRYERSLSERMQRLNELEALSQKAIWDAWVWNRYHSREQLLNEIKLEQLRIEAEKTAQEKTKQELEAQKAEQEKKRQEYLQEKLKKRQEKKEETVPPSQ